MSLTIGSDRGKKKTNKNTVGGDRGQRKQTKNTTMGNDRGQKKRNRKQKTTQHGSNENEKNVFGQIISAPGEFYEDWVIDNGKLTWQSHGSGRRPPVNLRILTLQREQKDINVVADDVVIPVKFVNPQNDPNDLNIRLRCFFDHLHIFALVSNDLIDSYFDLI